MPGEAQSLDGLLKQVAGRVFSDILRQQQPGTPERRAPEVSRPSVVIDAIPAALSQLGFDVGTVDGQCGPRTRRAGSITSMV